MDITPMKVALFYGSPEYLGDSVEWMKQEAISLDMEVELFSHVGEVISFPVEEFQGFMFMSFEGDPLITEWKSLASRLNIEEIPYIWAVEGNPFSGAFKSLIFFPEDEINAVAFFNLLRELPRPEKEKDNRPIIESVNQAVQVVNEFGGKIKSLASKRDELDNLEEDLQISENDLKNIIGVMGFPHSGTSFIAWNLAELIQANLIEGDRTDALAEWIDERDYCSREEFLRGNSSKRFALTADEPMTKTDLYELAKRKEVTVIDCGTNIPLWNMTGQKIFVMNCDPKYKKAGTPKDCKFVLNGYPPNFTFTPTHMFGRTFDLVLPALPREVQLSLWTGEAFIHRQNTHSKREWQELIEIHEDLKSKW